jgi:hypothetical protein
MNTIIQDLTNPVTYNGTPVQTNNKAITEDSFTAIYQSMTNDQVASMGGLHPSQLQSDETAEEVLKNGQLVYLQDGKYAVILDGAHGGGIALGMDNSPLVIDFRSLEDAYVPTYNTNTEEDTSSIWDLVKGLTEY